jgi:hypothetical protein
MALIICPECGVELDTEKHDITAHAIGHWKVVPRDIGTLRNSEAQRRYRALLEAAEGGV